MMKELNDKKNSFEIIKALSKGEVKKNEIIEQLGISQSTFYKYLSIMKELGFDILSDRTFYEIIRYKKVCKFDKSDINMFAYLLLIANLLLPSWKMKILKKAIYRILYLSDKYVVDEVSENYQKNILTSVEKYYKQKIAIIRKYISSNKIVLIVLKNKLEISAKPLDLFWKKDKIYLKYQMLDGIEKDIHIDNIVKIFEDEKQEIELNKSETLFELRGRLAKSYLLKDDERIIDYTKDKIVVINSSPDKNKLFKRLLRYDILCKVLFPKEDVEKMKQITQESLANLQCFYKDTNNPK